MGSRTYKARVLVLRKTRLGEKDLVVTMLDQEGRLVRGVAKGARRPGGSFASRLELFSEADVLMAQGRSLDTVCDAKFARSGGRRLSGLGQSLCASSLAEVLCSISQPDLEQPRIFDIAEAAFDRISALGEELRPLLAITSAGMWKVLAQAGFRPRFTTCVMCGKPVRSPSGRVPLAIADGGVTCGDCPRPADALISDYATLRWCDALIGMTYDEVIASGIDCATAAATLEVARMWNRVHTGKDVRSLDLLFTSGLF